MTITYTEEKSFTAPQLEELFKSVGWLSGNYPERLFKALKNCPTVITAWDGENLAGLINAIDDGELTAYVHYLCVNPKYQGMGIGNTLLEMTKEKYKNYLYFFLVAENPPLIKYYDDRGFEKGEDKTVMSITHK